MRHSLTSLGFPSSLRIASSLAALVVIATVMSATPAHAQNRAKVSIDFAFVAGGTAMEAGDYDIDATRDRVILRSSSGKGGAVIMPVITRLGRHDNDRDAELVFDKVGGKLLLSEFWIADLDGWLVLNTPVDHEHRVLGGSRPHK
jgi:hypothetical protein